MSNGVLKALFGASLLWDGLARAVSIIIDIVVMKSVVRMPQTEAGETESDDVKYVGFGLPPTTRQLCQTKAISVNMTKLYWSRDTSPKK